MSNISLKISATRLTKNSFERPQETLARYQHYEKIAFFFKKILNIYFSRIEKDATLAFYGLNFLRKMSNF